jgi:hypothetical protein
VEILGKIIAKILVDLLQSIQAREDLKAVVRAEMELLGLKNANEAIGWKAAAVGAPDGGATLAVVHGALQITLPGGHPDPPSGAPDSSVQPGPHPNPLPPRAGGG